MAQVYKMVDANGETRLFVEISPDPAFNGGTITAPVAITASGSVGVPLRVKNTDAAGSTALEIANEANAAVFQVSTGHATLGDQVSIGVPTQIAIDSTYATFGVLNVADSVGNNVFRVEDPNKLGFFNAAVAAKPTVTGAKLPSDVALASLLTGLATLGLITDSTT